MTKSAAMFKIKLMGIILFLSVLKVAAQPPPDKRLEEMLLAIQKSKPDTSRISLQLKLGDYYMQHSDKVKNYMDSAINLLNQAMQLSIKLHELDWQYNTLAQMGVYDAFNNDTERSKETFRSVILYSHQKSYLRKEAFAWDWLGDLYNLINDDQQERIGYYQHARSLYLQNHDPLDATRVLSKIAGTHVRTKQFKLAGNELLKVLTEYKALGIKDLQGSYLQLFNFEFARGNYYRALAYCLEEIRGDKAIENTPLSAYFYAGAAMCNDAVKRNEEAVKWSRKAIEAKNNQLGTLYISKCILVKNLVALNRVEEARVVLNDFSRGRPIGLVDTFYQYRMTALYLEKTNRNTLAVRYYDKILELERRKDIQIEVYEFWSVICNNEIAGIYLKANQAKMAKKYLDDASLTFKNAKTAIDPGFLADFYDHLYQYYLANGNYQAALKNLERRVKLQDSLFTADKDKQLAELNIQYQTTQQEQSIKTLHSQGAAQQAKLEKANLQRNVTIGGVLVMLTVSLLFFRNYRQKQTANGIITHKNKLLQHLLTEKEWLLKEVHHRVKNNLHTVICLLESQSLHLENDALKAIETSQNRIYAMSLIHQKLYQSDDVKTIDMSEYIPELIQSLEEAFGISSQMQIEFKLNIEPVNLAISHAIPVGLIINEAVTNSLKYAFPYKKKGKIFISMTDDGNEIKLELADNGIGMPEIDPKIEPESLGLRLMKGLSDDIDGKIGFEIDQGTKITIIFQSDGLNNSEKHLKSDELNTIYL